jgi:DNA invertase Pin-like site-specific DNA recombinase
MLSSLADAWAGTTNAHGKVMLTILGGLAELERSLIAARTAAGRERAKVAGVRFGRRPKLNAYQRAEALKRLDAGDPQSGGRAHIRRQTAGIVNSAASYLAERSLS